MKKSELPIILFVGKIAGHMVRAVRQYERAHKTKFRIAVLVDEKKNIMEEKGKLKNQIDLVLLCNTESPKDIQNTLLPYQPYLAAITCRGDESVPMLSRVIPHVPYLNTPTPESLLWATDKIRMRQRLRSQSKKISPSYTIVRDTSPRSLKKIEKKVGFPLVAKPAGLGASRLVSICYHKKELIDVLKKTYRKIGSVYKKTNGRGKPRILVEQFMDGDMYSIDVYVSSRGTVWFTPLAHIKTGRAIGFDDFFGYEQMAPTLLSKENIKKAEAVAREAVHALALRSSTAHIELMKTERGWKVIELGPRIGGFRHKMYEYSFGINHTVNDILVRMDEKPILPKKILGHTVAMKFFAKKEGKLSKLLGIKKSKTLSSFKHLYLHKKIGDACTYAKHGGSSVFDIILFNKKRPQLLADIRRLEQMVKIETTLGKLGK